MKKLIIGAGFSGAVLARELAEAGFLTQVIDKRSHIGGNCHTERDQDSGVMEHVYGPHIFNTSNEEVWNYVQRFCTMVPYINRVKASNERGVFSMPINLHTINQFFGKKFNPNEARAFVERLGDHSIQKHSSTATPESNGAVNRGNFLHPSCNVYRFGSITMIITTVASIKEYRSRDTRR